MHQNFQEEFLVSVEVTEKKTTSLTAAALDTEEDENSVVFERYCPQLRVPPPKFSLGCIHLHFFGK